MRRSTAGRAGPSSLSDLAKNPKILELYVLYRQRIEITNMNLGKNLCDGFAKALSPTGC
jgi:hypothetical protein